MNAYREVNPIDLNQLFDVTDKVIVITGANKGIGKDLAKFLSSAGAHIALIARNEKDLIEAATEIEAFGKRVLPISVDLTNIKEIPQAIEQIYHHFGKIDVLINNAGTNIPKPPEEVTEEDWDKILDINLKSVFFLTQAVGKLMVKRKQGKIINISSQMAFVGYYDRSVYCSSKGGVNQLTKALAIEWAPYKINVNAVAPTFIETPMTEPMFEDDHFKEEVLKRIPLGRMAKTEDLFGVIIYLASGASDMVTGQTFAVDGGWTVW